MDYKNLLQIILVKPIQNYVYPLKEEREISYFANFSS